MRNSKALRGICYCLIPILVFLIAFSFFYELRRDYLEDNSTYYLEIEDEFYYSEDGYVIDENLSANRKELLNLLDSMTFMEYAAPVIIPVCTLFLLVIVIYLVISIGHTRRKRRYRLK